MSFGLSLNEALQHVQDVNALQSESAAGEQERNLAAGRIRDHLVNRFPKAVAEDWRLMQMT